MKMKDFIDQHQREIDDAINAAIYRWDGNGRPGKVPTPAPTYDNQTRRDWIANDEGLYRWARSEGVRI